MNNPNYIDDQFRQPIHQNDHNSENIKESEMNNKTRNRAVSFSANIINNEPSSEKEWSSYTKKGKISYIIFAFIKIIMFIVLLYMFLLSLNFMTIGFTMVAGYAIKAGPIIKFILSNPFAALAIGIIATAIMQNATATTSIAVSMVGAGIIPDVPSAIPIIMGSNIGTCVTNSLIALTLAGDPNEFKRAFSGATLNDMFNLLTTTILLPIEILSHFLYVVSTKLAELMPLDNPAQMASANFMAFILNPLCDLFIVLDSNAVNALSNGSDITEVALRCCQKDIIKVYNNYSQNSTTRTYFNETDYTNKSICLKKCTYWCMPMLEAFGDGGTGLFWIILSIAVLIACLFGIVKVLSLLIVGPIAKGVRIAVNASFPKPFGWMTEILLFIIAFMLTIVVQSSNIITATLVPLCGVGIVSLQRVFVMTLGSNIGTTVTGILTAFTQPASSLKKSMQLAFVYTLFNLLGVLFWLPIPFLRFPKRLARALGNIVLKYRWFLYIYVLTVYFIGPLFIFGLAEIPMWIGLAIFGIPLIIMLLLILILKLIQSKIPRILPIKLRNFDFLPIWLRSLEPLDKKMKKIKCCCKKKSNTNAEQITHLEKSTSNASFSFSNAIRRLSAIEGLVTEGINYSRRNSLTLVVENDSDSDSDKKHISDPLPLKVSENEIITRF